METWYDATASATFAFPARWDGYNAAAHAMIERRVRRLALRRLERALGQPVTDALESDLSELCVHACLSADRDGYPVSLRVDARARRA